MKPNLGLFAIWILVGVTIQFVYFCVLRSNIDAMFPTLDTLQKLSLFGGIFGGVSAFFSAVTSAGLIYTLLVQRNDSISQKIRTEQINDNQRKMYEIFATIAALNALSSQLESANLEYDLMVRKEYLDTITSQKKEEIEKLKTKINEQLSKINLVSEKVTIAG